MLSEVRRIKLTRLFDLRDADNDGVLNQEDYEAFARQVGEVLGWKVGTERYNMMLEAQLFGWARMLEFADPDNDKQITLEEYLNAYDIMDGMEPIYNNVEQTIHFAFGWFDKSEDGYLNLDEFSRFLTIFGISGTTAQHAFTHLDDKKKGKISKDQFRDHMTEFFLSDEPDAAGNYFFGGYTQPLDT